MTTLYKLTCGYTKLGEAYTPVPPPTIKVVDSSNNLLVNAAATTARSNIAGVFDYTYSGADNLDLIALFHTTDATVDRKDLHSHPYDAVILKAIETVDTVVDAIKVKTDFTPSVQAGAAGGLFIAGTNAPTTGTPTAESIADAIWDELLSGHLIPGTPGDKLNELVNADLSALATAANLTTTQSQLEIYISNETGPLASSAAVGLVSSVVNTLPSAAEIDAQLSGTHGAGTWGNATGGGAVLETVTVTVSGLPRDGVEVWVTTDEAGLNLVANGVTDALGQVDFMLDPGTYYVWKQLAGVNFTNPQTTVVS
jgi:hypothetical protein